MKNKKIKSIQADNQPGKFHRNDNFTEYYFTVDDTTGTKKEKTFIGRIHDDWGTDFHAIAQRINKHIDKNFNQGKIK